MLERASLNWILAGTRLLRINGKNNTVGRCPPGGILRSSPVFRPSIMSFYISIPGLTHSPTKNRGQIQIILGPMFSGKSTELMRRIKRYSYADHDCLIIKYAKDCRYSDDYMSTHDKHMLPAIKAEKLSNVELPTGCSVIGIDEGQFFPDIVEFSERMASRGIRVIVAALDGTFQRKPFGSILDLIPLAESVIKLNAVCMMCRGEAAFTKRIGSETKVEVIGGTDKYMAVCRDCYNKLPGSSAKKQRPALGELCLNQQDLTPECDMPAKHKKALISKKLFDMES